ncbi:ComEC/Rec2 family competence protein [Roseibium denhamense]|uniref:ComEC/Rec2 family competence protein n=1 Tax=Roseibium denhamense TaxID=76305 RepID=UPI0018AD1ADB|nr:ComEC/Rec2 family competence protein [Roseibium denhamense]
MDRINRARNGQPLSESTEISGPAGAFEGRSRARSPIDRFLPGRTGAESVQTGRDREAFWDQKGLLCLAFSYCGGIGLYAVLPQEPLWLAVAALMAAIAGTAYFCGYGRSLALLLVLTLLGGVCAGALRSDLVAGPKLAEPVTAALVGTVLSSQAGVSGPRLVLKVEAINKVPAAALRFPEKVRIRVPPASTHSVGETISLRARLFPPSGPVMPGGYDFSFRAFFQTLGATGYSYGPPRKVPAEDVTTGIYLAGKVDRFRQYLSGQIRESLKEGPSSALAVALLVGDRNGISDQEEEDLRAAGLAHILAISGLHMALFAGGAYSVLLFVFAAIGPVAVRWPIHKLAAIAALAAAVFYLVISGASVATQRSFLMIALVFLGVVAGRRGLTLRSVALAALFLLLLAPERLFHPGFQMSFAAVVCLVAVYDGWRDRSSERLRNRRPHGLPVQVIRFCGKWAAGLIVTAAVAGLATGIIGAYHFGRIAPYGLIGNLLGMPVFSLIVMPMGVLALVLMPFGLASLPLAVMAFALEVLMEIAAFTAALSAGSGAIGNLPAFATLWLMTGLFLGLLAQGRWRVLAVGPFVAAAAVLWDHRPPDVQISDTGMRLAARDSEGVLKLSDSRSSFVSDVWLQADGSRVQTIKSRKMKSPQRKCDASGCITAAYSAHQSIPVGGGGSHLLISQPKTAEALREDCHRADLIVTDLIAPQNCPALVFDGPFRREKGAISIWLARPDRGQYGPSEQMQARSAAKTEPVKERVSDANRGRSNISKMRFALSAPKRPWHKDGTVTNRSLREQIAAFLRERGKDASPSTAY